MTGDLHDLAAPYALDALDAVERRSFELHLDGCGECRAALEALREGATHLALFEAAPAPPALRDRVLAAAAETPQERDVISLAARRRARPARILSMLAAAVILLAGAGLALNLLGSGTSASDVLAAPDLVNVELAPTDAYGDEPVQATVSFSPGRQAAVVTFAGLAPVGDDETYELWVVDEAGAKPAGLFRPGGDGRAQALVDGTVAPGVTIAITREPAGGVDVATGEVLFAGSV